MAHQIRPGPLSPDAQLLRRSGAEGISRAQEDLFPFPGEPGGHFPDGGGLSHPVHPDHQDHGGGGLQMEPGISRLPKGGGEAFLQGGADLVSAVQPLMLRPLPQLINSRYGQFRSHIRQDQRFFQFVEELVIRPGKAVQQAGKALSGLAQAGADLLKQTHGLRLRIPDCFLQVHPKDLGNAFLHRNAVEHIRFLHASPTMGDDQELGV